MLKRRDDSKKKQKTLFLSDTTKFECDFGAIPVSEYGPFFTSLRTSLSGTVEKATFSASSNNLDSIAQQKPLFIFQLVKTISSSLNDSASLKSIHFKEISIPSKACLSIGNFLKNSMTIEEIHFSYVYLSTEDFQNLIVGVSPLRITSISFDFCSLTSEIVPVLTDFIQFVHSFGIRSHLMELSLVGNNLTLADLCPLDVFVNLEVRYLQESDFIFNDGKWIPRPKYHQSEVKNQSILNHSQKKSSEMNDVFSSPHLPRSRPQKRSSSAQPNKLNPNHRLTISLFSSSALGSIPDYSSKNISVSPLSPKQHHHHHHHHSRRKSETYYIRVTPPPVEEIQYIVEHKGKHDKFDKPYHSLKRKKEKERINPISRRKSFSSGGKKEKPVFVDLTTKKVEQMNIDNYDGTFKPKAKEEKKLHETEKISDEAFINPRTSIASHVNASVQFNSTEMNDVFVVNDS